MFEVVESGVGAAFGGNTKEAQACIVVWCGSVEAATPTPSLVPRGKESAGGGMWGGSVWSR